MLGPAQGLGQQWRPDPACTRPCTTARTSLARGGAVQGSPCIRAHRCAHASSVLCASARGQTDASAAAQPGQQDTQQGCSVSDRLEGDASRNSSSGPEVEQELGCTSSRRGRRAHDASLSRRHLLAGAGASAAALAGGLGAGPASALTQTACLELYSDYLQGPPNFAGPGPFTTARLPRLEHVCTSCFGACAGTSCLIRIDVTYPRGGGYALGVGPPYPLAIFSSGFLLRSDSYRSYSQRLASWGYVTLLYDKLETVSDLLDDVTSVKALRQLINWADSDPLMRRITDASRVYLIGHSRGGKITTLAACADPRVAAACLLDPVDNTVYAPLAPGYPSAVEALQGKPSEELDVTVPVSSPEAVPLPPDSPDLGTPGMRAAEEEAEKAAGASSVARDWALLTTSGSSSSSTSSSGSGASGGAAGAGKRGSGSKVSYKEARGALARRLPLAIVGSGQGGDCAPRGSNYLQFFEAAQGPAWQVELSEAGHFSYLDDTSPLQRAVCPGGALPDSEVQQVAQTVMVAWAECMVRGRGRDMLREGATPPYPNACINQGPPPKQGRSSRRGPGAKQPVSSQPAPDVASGNAAAGATPTASQPQAVASTGQLASGVGSQPQEQQAAQASRGAEQTAGSAGGASSEPVAPAQETQGSGRSWERRIAVESTLPASLDKLLQGLPIGASSNISTRYKHFEGSLAG